MRLQGDYIDYANKTVKNLVPGDIIVWNYGYKSEVLKLLPSKTGKTYAVILRSLQDGVMRSRKMGANTQVAMFDEALRMKTYLIYLSDAPNDPIKCVRANKSEARKAGQQYIKLWKLAASIVRIEEVK